MPSSLSMTYVTKTSRRTPIALDGAGGNDHRVGRYSYSLKGRARLRAWRTLNGAVDRLRKPIQKAQVLVVTGDASEAKVSEVEARLRFLFSHIGEVPQLRRVRRASLSSYLRNAGVVAVDAKAVPERVRRHTRWVANLDYETNASDGWDLFDFGVALADPTLDAPISRGRAIFNSRVEELKARGPRPAYMFGTGPSLRLAEERSFSDGTTIVCNTIVRDAELWHKLNPAFFAAGDAIYHFGPTAHARAFRADLLRRLQESEGRTLFVYPAPYDIVIRPEFKEVEGLLIPIPRGTHTDISNDLLHRFSLPSVGNVLNGLLLPLACTLSRDIRLWGFDGRAPDDTGFWAYSSQHAYVNLIQSIRDAHPAFFDELLPKGNEFKYVKQNHGDRLNERLAEAEGRGFRFSMLHPSWTAVLQDRYREDSPGALSPAEWQTVITSS